MGDGRSNTPAPISSKPTAGGLVEVHIDALQLQVALAAVLQGRRAGGGSGGQTLHGGKRDKAWACKQACSSLTVPVGSTPCSSHTTCSGQAKKT
jgi:hypothetical protein